MAAIVVLPLLGVTWIIGILAVNNDTQVFEWIFVVFSALQVRTYLAGLQKTRNSGITE